MNEEVINTLWGVSPANWMGYGLAIIVLCLAVYFLTKELMNERKLNTANLVSYMDHINSILTKIEIRLEDQQSMLENQSKILNECEKINAKINAKNN